MGKHKDPDVLSFIEWLRQKGESLGFLAKSEYALHKKEYFVDLVWKLHEDLDLYISFEIETKDGDSIFRNTYKIFGPPSKLVSKPWRHFMIVYKTRLSESHRNALSNTINQHNIFLFENVFNEATEMQNLEKRLEESAYDISELIKAVTRVSPLGTTLSQISNGLKKGLMDWIKDPKIAISIGSSVPIEFAVTTRSPFIEKIEEAKKTLKPITVEIDDFDIEGIPVFDKDKVIKMEMTLAFAPTPSYIPLRIEVPRTKVFFEKLLFRRIKTEGTIGFFSTEDRNLPFVFEFNMDIKKKYGGFNLRFEPSHGDVKQSYQFEELVRVFNKQKELRIVDPEKNKTILNFHLKESLIQQNKRWYELISKLCYIQEKTKHFIPAPTEITSEDSEAIESVYRIITTGEDKGIINKIPLRVDKQQALYLINVMKEQGYIWLEASGSPISEKIFKEIIPLGPSIVKFPDMQFALSVEEVEKIVEDTPDEGFIDLTLRPLNDNRITIIYEKWSQKNRS